MIYGHDHIAMITQAHPSSSPTSPHHLRWVYRSLSSFIQLLYHHSTFVSMGFVIYYQSPFLSSNSLDIMSCNIII